MHEKSEKQMPLTAPVIDHPRAAELETVSCILESNDTILDHFWEDLGGSRAERRSGANGMTAEQVMRAAVAKQIFGYSYRDFAFHIADSISLSRFFKIA